MRELGSDDASSVVLFQQVAARVSQIRERIAEACARSGRQESEVTLVAITKTRTVDEIEAVLAAGVLDIGENYVQEASRKVAAVGRTRCRWHLIGHLQRNKARAAVEFVDWLHTIDSLRIAEEVGRRAVAAGRTIEALVEVNVGGEVSKHGILPVDLVPLYERVSELEGVRLRGLMTVAPWSQNPQDVRPVFATLRELAEDLRSRGLRADVLSMGMTGDYEVAIEAGATMVRLGTAVFGPRAA